MNRPVAPLTLCAAFILAAPAPAFAALHRDAANGFKVDLPDGWLVMPPSSGLVLKAVPGGNKVEPDSPSCAVMKSLAPTQQFSQQALNQAMAQKFADPQYWLTSARQFGADARVTATGSAMHGGAQAGTMTFEHTNKSGVALRTRAVHFMVPGHYFQAICVASVRKYDKVAPAFERFLGTLAPL
jgi:hypothetical protein